MIVSKFVLPRTHCNKHLDKFVNSRIDSYISHIPFIDRTTRPPLISLTMTKKTNIERIQTVIDIAYQAFVDHGLTVKDAETALEILKHRISNAKELSILPAGITAENFITGFPLK